MTTPILFLHGWAMDGAIFDDVRDLLGADYACHAPDLPGHGKAEVGGMEACVALVNDWVQRLDRPILVGWSMGAGAAWSYLARFGTGNVRGLATIDMSPRMVPDPQWRFGLNGKSPEVIRSTSAKIIPKWPHMASSVVRNMYAPGSLPQMTRDRIERHLLAQDPSRLVPMWEDLVAMDARTVIPQIDIPYLICAGEHSRLYDPATADWLANMAPNARAHRFQHSGHSPHLEEPDAFCDAIRHFAETIVPSAPSQQKEEPK